MKSPNPTKNKPTNTKCWTGKNPKITKVQNQPPTRRGQKHRGRPKIRETCSTTPHAHRTKQMTQSIIEIQPRHHRHTPTKRHTPHSAQKRGRQTHPRNKSTLAHYRVLKQHQHTQHQPTHSESASSDFGIRQRLFSCPPHKPERISSSSGALSVSLTRYKLHTPHTQHKPAARRGFYARSTCAPSAFNCSTKAG